MEVLWYMEEEIQLSELLELLWKRKLIILIAVVLCTAASLAYSIFMVTPIYQSDTTLMVNGKKGFDAGDIAASFDLGTISANQKLVVTYGEIVRSRIVLEQVIAQLELEDTYEDMLTKVVSKPVGTTEILKISVTDVDPVKAALIANTISDVFVKEVIRILKVDNVEMIDKAIPIDEPINVKTLMNIAIAIVLGGMIGVFIIFALEALDNTIKTPEDVEKYIGLPLLGMIPEFEQTKQTS